MYVVKDTVHIQHGVDAKDHPKGNPKAHLKSNLKTA